MNFNLPPRLTRLSRRFLTTGRSPGQVIEQTLRDAGLMAGPRAASSPRDGEKFGANPGALGMQLYQPEVLRPRAPLLVLLHGCGQDATVFAQATGFIGLADRLGAPLLLPEQRAQNNAGRCFNWFEPADIRRGTGEAASIRQMVAHALQTCGADADRVFIAGLSAGAAMAAAMLAAYPDVFAAGAVVAGLPVGMATDVPGALARMRHAGTEPQSVLVERAAPPRAGGIAWPRWPRLSVWHGDADTTVDPANADQLVAQWTGLLHLSAEPDREDQIAPGIGRRVWGRSVEQWNLANFGHAFPASQPGPDPFVQPAPIAACDAIARFWGLEEG